MVLVHGTMDRATSFAKAIRRLDGTQVLASDRAGYGTRAGERPPDPRVLGDAADLLARLDDQGPPAVAVGHSYGGHVALAAAIERPDLVRAVALYETPLAWMGWWPPDTAGGRAVRRVDVEGGTPADAAETFMRSIVGDEVWERLPAATQRARRAEGPALLADLRDIQRPGDPPYDPTSVTVPVVLARGRESTGQHRLGLDEWRRLFPAAPVVLLDGAGHGGHASHPDGFADLVRTTMALATGP
ncbi:MAG TPA: alpha/beta hydrolase [Acidimicrobiales bacterium]|nr:alpha/beta hydrolase [Acidimicrobiales bacterium]